MAHLIVFKQVYMKFTHNTIISTTVQGNLSESNIH